MIIPKNSCLPLLASALWLSPAVLLEQDAAVQAQTGKVLPDHSIAIDQHLIEGYQSSEGMVITPTVSDILLPPAESMTASDLKVPDRFETSPPEANRLDPFLDNRPIYRFQGIVIQEGNDTAGRGRATVFYPISDRLLLGSEIDITAGRGFSQNNEGSLGIDFNELYVAASVPGVPELRLVAGLMDLTSYFDRNSFAKDRATHFFNGVFQTNPALSAAGIASRPGVLVNWSPADVVELKAVAFSSNRGPSNLAVDAFAGEVGVRIGSVILRGTYVTAKDGGRESGFEEIFGLRREGDEFGIKDSDREEAFGLNAEALIPGTKVGLFGRYGHYRNQAVDETGNTYSFGLNVLDVLRTGDRLGLGYGRQLSNDDLRRGRGDRVPDVVEAFYDVRLTRNVRGALTIQARDQFSEPVFGARIRADF